MILLYIPFLISFILLIWFKSDAFVSWGNLFGLSKFLHIDEFDTKVFESLVKGQPYSYPQFLKDKFNYNFITKLIGCPMCLSVWLSIFICGVISIITFNFIFLFMIPVICISSLLLYGSVVSVLKLP